MPTLLESTHGALARLIYGTGLRITEALQLRINGIDFDRKVIGVRGQVQASLPLP